MKPYGRCKNIKGNGAWKVPHININGKKINAWWSDMDTNISRSMIKQAVKKEVIEDITDTEYFEDFISYYNNGLMIRVFY